MTAAAGATAFAWIRPGDVIETPRWRLIATVTRTSGLGPRGELRAVFWQTRPGDGSRPTVGVTVRPRAHRVERVRTADGREAA